MSKKFVTIAKIGEKVNLNNISHTNKVFRDEFNFERKSYKLLLDIDISKVLKGNVKKSYSFEKRKVP